MNIRTMCHIPFLGPKLYHILQYRSGSLDIAAKIEKSNSEVAGGVFTPDVTCDGFAPCTEISAAHVKPAA